MVWKRGLHAGMATVIVLLLATAAAVSAVTAVSYGTTTSTDTNTADAVEGSTTPTSGSTGGSTNADYAEPGDGGAEPQEPEPSEPSCEDRLHDAYQEIRSWYAEAEEAWDDFIIQQEAEARALRDRDASPDEWREAQEQWAAEADDLHRHIVARFWDRAYGHLGDCADRLGEPHRLWDASWLQDDEPEPARGDAPAPYAPPPKPEPHPFADDAEWQALEAKVERVRADCRERVDALWRESEGEDDAAWRERVHDAERECALKIRLLYEEYYDRQERDFGDSLGSLRMTWSDEEDRIIVTGRHLELRGDPDTATMEDLACRGPVYVDRIAADGFLAEFRPEETDSGTALRVFDDDGGRVFSLHDNERCTVNIASTDAVPWVVLDLADRLSCERTGAGDIDCRDGDLRIMVLVHDGGAELHDGNELVVRGRATFLVSRAPAEDDAPRDAAYEEAVRQKHVGAEVQIARGSDGLAVDAAPIGDLEVRVTGGLDGIDVFVDSAQGEGKTLSLAVDAALLRNALPGITAYAVEADGETPIEVREADSLEDVLDPLDDGEAVEYWFLEEDGASWVLVSIPHFSEKRIHISPDVLGSIGIPAPGLAWFAPLLGAAVYAARRRS